MKVIDYKQIDLTDAEYQYYLKLVANFNDKEKGIKGQDYFRDIFETDSNGCIILIKTERSIPWAILFFVQQVMINQRIRINDQILQENKKLIEELKELKNLIQQENK